MVDFRNLTRKKIEFGDFKKLYKIIFKKEFCLSVVFAPPKLMKLLNQKYRGRDKPANVLSFCLEKNCGEIFLNAGEKDLPYLFTHACLHLLGYNHKKNKESEKMEKLERKILNNLK